MTFTNRFSASSMAVSAHCAEAFSACMNSMNTASNAVITILGATIVASILIIALVSVCLCVLLSVSLILAVLLIMSEWNKCRRHKTA